MAQISVIICTHDKNRLSAVLAAVASVKSQTRLANETIVVVDHNPSLLTHLKGELHGVQVVENSENKGLSGGRNTGIAMAHGDIVAFLDDDAVAEPEWLAFLSESYADPAVVGVGGLTLPRWVSIRPSWFPPEFDWVIGCTYIGMPKTRGPVRNLHGGNASFRRDAFHPSEGFRNGIGRSIGRLPLGCEETEFCIRLSQRHPGALMVFEPRAVIWHLIPVSRCRISYFWMRCFAEGISKSQVTACVGLSDSLASERRYVSRTLPIGIARGLLDCLRGRPSGLLRATMIVAGLGVTVMGYIVGSIRHMSWSFKLGSSTVVAHSGERVGLPALFWVTRDFAVLKSLGYTKGRNVDINAHR